MMEVCSLPFYFCWLENSFHCWVFTEIEIIFVVNDFIGIHTPKLISGSSEGGAAYSNLHIMAQPALEQSDIVYYSLAFGSNTSREYIF